MRALGSHTIRRFSMSNGLGLWIGESSPTSPATMRSAVGIALKEKTDALNLEAHLKYPGADVKYNSLVEFFVDKLLKK